MKDGKLCWFFSVKVKGVVWLKSRHIQNTGSDCLHLAIDLFSFLCGLCKYVKEKINMVILTIT